MKYEALKISFKILIYLNILFLLIKKSDRISKFSSKKLRLNVMERKENLIELFYLKFWKIFFKTAYEKFFIKFFLRYENSVKNWCFESFKRGYISFKYIFQFYLIFSIHIPIESSSLRAITDIWHILNEIYLQKILIRVLYIYIYS